MDPQGPDLLPATRFAVLGAGLGLVCDVGQTFGIDGSGPAQVRLDQTPKP